MKIEINGSINPSYVQNLFLIFFPGSKFSGEESGEELPFARVVLTEDEVGARAVVTLKDEMGNEASEEAFFESSTGYPRLRCAQLAVGAAFCLAGEKLFNYMPPWGILTGIRPAKIAEQLYREFGTKTAVKKILKSDYLVSPKKAQLLTNVAVREMRNLGKFREDSCSLYVSVPFCPTRCAYCSFVSYSTKRLLSMIPAYLERLLHDIDRLADAIEARGQRVQTVYIGGGTPTTLDAEQLTRAPWQGWRNGFRPATLREFTLEAGRPDTLTKEKLRVAAESGVSRISVNPQTLSDEVLAVMGRRHTVADFYRGYALAKESGIPCINTDLIAGLPGDSFENFSGTMDKILLLRPENITVHTFCVKRSADILRQGKRIFSRTGGDAVKSVDYSQLRCMNQGYLPYYLYRQKNMAGNLENVGFTLPGSTATTIP